MLRMTCAALSTVALLAVVRLLWRRDRTLGAIIAAGVAIRLVASVALFVISYYHLPIARELQRDDGLWFFALDSTLYLGEARNVAARGLQAIASVPMTLPSVSYIQLLGLSVYAMGTSTLVAILLNLWAFTIAGASIVWWAHQFVGAKKAAVFALAALAFSPASVLWATAPLKDTVFASVFIVFASCAAVWIVVWHEPRPSRLFGAASLAGMAFTMFIVAGLRWYFAFAMLAGLALLFLRLSTAQARPWRAAGVSLVALFLVSRGLLFGAPTGIPREAQLLLWPFGRPPVTSLPSGLLTNIDRARAGFVASGGSTAIVRPPADLPEATVDAAETAARPATGFGLVALNQWPQGSDPSSTVPAVVVERVTPGSLAARAGLRATDVIATFDGAPVTDAYALRRQVLSTPLGGTFELGFVRAGRSRTLRVQVDQQFTPPPPLPTPPPLPGLSPNGATAALGEPELPPMARTARWNDGADGHPRGTRGATVSALSRLLSITPWAQGAVAMFVPTTLQRLFGIEVVSGGRGLLVVTDVDTLIFDAVLFYAFFVTLRARASYRSGLFLLTLLVTMVILVPLLYTVTNFGTLFRLRGMVYVTAALLPLAAASLADRIVPNPRRFATR